MSIRIAPPIRTSNSQRGLVHPCGPHHCATCFGSVHILKTSRRDASKTRANATSMPRPSDVVLLLALLWAMFLLLALQFAKIVAQTIEALFPETAIVLHPVGDVLERTCLEPAGPPLRLAPAHDQSRAFEHLQVFGNGRQADVERISQFRHGSPAGHQAREDGAPGGIGKGREGGAELIGG